MNKRTLLRSLSPIKNLSPSRQSSSSSFSSSSSSPSSQNQSISSILSKPTWSIRSLLPPSSLPPPGSPQSSTPQRPSSQTLTHLLKLSSLPAPESPSALLSTLHSQLHFLQALQSLQTPPELTPPLSSIRDETPLGLSESTISLSHPAIQKALAQEEVVGKWRRPRRARKARATTPSSPSSPSPPLPEKSKGNGARDGEMELELKGKRESLPPQLQQQGITQTQNPLVVEDWDVLGQASEKVGGYFVVRSGKNTGE
ncbi:hypothetical protein QBC42DRAFT_287183 [Cladorrhinum samala]|uniref:Uncharacterized protein n=1 Tax=Cladorrhinum samala TaxID=585594 RepID=A0AAV9HP33_9PEZI|nr:hypothetical protein QBC42DRAFT_287183 [Cladorrhinum samala]